jgi:hypothetical protein
MTPSESANQLLAEFSSPHRFDEFTISVEPALPLIEAAEYDATIVACRFARRFGRDLLAFTFRIVTEGRAAGTELQTFLNVERDRKGKLKIRSRMKLAGWIHCLQLFAPEISVRSFSIKTFSQFLFLVSVRTVVKGHDQKPLPDEECYSTVDNIVGVVGRLKLR